MMFKILFFIFALIAHNVLSYEILLAFPVSTKHVSNVFCGIARGLVSRGHKVSILSTYPPNFSHENLTIYKVANCKPLLENLNQFNLNSTILNKHVLETMRGISKEMWEDINIKACLAKKDKFSAVIIPRFLNEIAYPFLVDFSGAFIEVFSPGMEQFIISQKDENKFPPVNPSFDGPYVQSYSLREKFMYSLSALNDQNASDSGIFPGTQKIVNTYHKRVQRLEQYVFSLALQTYTLFPNICHC